MAITELAAIEAAYHALQPLSPGARRRAVRWLSDALETEDDLTPPAPADSGVPAGAAFETPSVGAAGPSGGPVAGRAGTGAAAGAGRGGRSRRAGGRAAATARGDGSTGAPPAPAPAAAPSKSARQRRRVGRPDIDRAYRRMPTADEVMDAYRTVGTVTGLAEHFGVPTHTVQGWARRLRSQGYQIGRGARDA
jgi:hypothetical protein